MKQTALIILAITLLPMLARSQDVITTTSGDNIQGRVFKITAKLIKYKNTGVSDSGVLHTIPKKEVYEINYQTGVKESFNQDKYVDDNDPEGHWDKRSMAALGREDAQEYYKSYQGPKWWAFGTTVCVGAIISLVPTIIIASTPPSDRNLDYPDEELMKSKKYSNAYRREARKIKSRKTWGGFGIGVATNVATGLIFIHF